MSKTIRIGTRDSELALWQANTVKAAIEKLGCRAELVPVKSTGDIILNKPLYELGITGIFTKTLDIAMLAGQIDIAVHSMKDVPTQLPQGIVKAAVLKRAPFEDILVHKGSLDFLTGNGTIATGSLRRKAQWLHKYPEHNVCDLRGNVNTRLQKLNGHDWDGAIFAKAGLERIELTPENHITLGWMIPAPAQGAMLIVCMDNDPFIKELLAQLNDEETDICTHIERDFLRTLEGGCTAPIGAIATITEDTVSFTGALFSLNGKQKIMTENTVAKESFSNFGRMCATNVLENGGREMMNEIRTLLKSTSDNG